jgi:hypothetical protein
VLDERLRHDIRVERVDEHAERQLALELGAGARQHDVTALVGAHTQLGQQPRLAYPWLSLDADAGGRAAVQRVQRRVQPRQLLVAPDDPPDASVRVHRAAMVTACEAVSGCGFRDRPRCIGGAVAAVCRHARLPPGPPARTA